MSIAEHIRVITAFHEGRGDYGRPLVPSEVRRFETELGGPFPPEQAELFGLVSGGPFLDGYRLLDPEGVIREKQMWDEVGEDWDEEDEEDIVAYPPDQVARKYWQIGWVPFLQEEGTGHGFAIDTAPLPNGRMGQIVNYGPDDDGRYLCAPSLEAFLGIIATEITAGRVEWDGDECRLQAAEGYTLLHVFTKDPAIEAYETQVREEKKRAREARNQAQAQAAKERAQAAAQAKAGQGGAATASPTTEAAASPAVDPLTLQVHPDGRIIIRHSSSEPAHVEPLASAENWIRHAATTAQPIQVSGPLSDEQVGGTIERLREAARGRPVTVTDEALEPLGKGWTGMMWAAWHGRTDLVKDLVARGFDPRTAPRTFGGLLPGPTAYDLAMRRGHVPVLQALREAGVPNPVRGRPPGAPEAIVLRAATPTWPYAVGVLAVVVGAVLALVTRSWTPLIALGLMGVMVAALTAFIGAIAGGEGMAVDGSRLWTRRNFRWHGPVELPDVLAVGLSESAHVRSPTLLRLGTADQGSPVGRLTSSGFDPDQVTQLKERDGRVFTLHFGGHFRPGVEQYVGTQIDLDRTTVSESAKQTVVRKG